MDSRKTSRWDIVVSTIPIHQADGIKVPPDDWCGTQNPREFEQFVDRLLMHRVRSIVCIGIADGGNQWRIARRYQQAGVECRILAIDVRLTLNLARVLSLIRIRFPNVDMDFRLADSRQLTPEDLGGPFDAGWIDGTHAYAVAKRDYELLDPIVTRLLAFHDINNVGFENDSIGSHDLWEEIKQDRSFEEFIYGKKMGIGILYKHCH